MGPPAANMTEKQRTLLVQLIQTYADRLPSDVAKAEMDQVKEGENIAVR